ncbi:APC family permease [Rathayibacter soli]|uniref:APC family permease n=1 Tax=Rathayibacter soli TaxID=3144168 RepID=UPI0027E5AB45|nr:APC family permease [Glaciibacter superstes]
MTATTPHLKRALGLRSLVLFGLAYMAPLIVLGTFGVVATVSKGATAGAYILALIAMLFTASSYGRMAAAYPVSGSAYTYVGKVVDIRAGFLVGWAVMLDYMFLPMVIWLIGAAFLKQAAPSVPSWVWIVAFIVVTTGLNILGIKVADKANFALMTFEILVLVIFVVLSIMNVIAGGHGMTLDPFTNPDSSFTAISGGAAIAAYSFLGFDAITTFTEETRNPTKTVPRAILLVALIGGIIFVVVAYSTQLVHPGFHFADESSAAFEIAAKIGGSLFSAVFLAGLVVTQFASGIAAQASASRLLFAMGRDGVLPKRIFAQISKKFQTPVLSLLVIGVIGFIALFLDVATSTSFINFGAFTAFTMVNVSVVFYYFRQRRAGVHTNVVLYLIAPIVGAIITLYLLTQLDMDALILGSSWLVLGIIVLAVLTHGFRRRPPEMDYVEVEDEELQAVAQ